MTDTNLESQETDEQENEVQADENNANEEGEASEGTEAEGSEAEDSEDGESESGGDGGQEADKKESNNRSAQHRVSNRIRKLNGDKSQLESGNQELQNQLAIANQRIEIMQLASNRNGAEKKPVEPSPDDFEDGVQDPKYVKKFQEYLRDQNKEEIKQEVSRQTKTHQDTASTDNLQRDTERKQKEHYRKALTINSDYEEKEDALINIIGSAGVKAIINGCEDSHEIIYRLGADEDLAFELADALESKKDIKAIRLLERASKPGSKKPKQKPTPNPDTPLPGGSPAAATGFEAKRLKVLEKSQKAGDQSIYSDFMDDHRKELQKEKAKHLPW